MSLDDAVENSNSKNSLASRIKSGNSNGLIFERLSPVFNNFRSNCDSNGINGDEINSYVSLDF